MKFKKLFDTQGRTAKIVIEKNGVYFAVTPKEAAQLINLLIRALWCGIPVKRWTQG